MQHLHGQACDAFYKQTVALNALQGELSPGLIVRFVSIPALIEMKKLANRPRDVDDIEHLRMILEEQRRNERER